MILIFLTSLITIFPNNMNTTDDHTLPIVNASSLPSWVNNPIELQHKIKAKRSTIEYKYDYYGRSVACPNHDREVMRGTLQRAFNEYSDLSMTPFWDIIVDFDDKLDNLITDYLDKEIFKGHDSYMLMCRDQTMKMLIRHIHCCFGKGGDRWEILLSRVDNFVNNYTYETSFNIGSIINKHLCPPNNFIKNPIIIISYLNIVSHKLIECGLRKSLILPSTIYKNYNKNIYLPFIDKFASYIDLIVHS